MSRSLWKPSLLKISCYPAIELRTVCLGYENIETCLSGLLGEIWEVGPGRYRAIQTRGFNGQLLANEQLVRFGDSDLDVWVRRLRVPEDPKDQTQFANTFGWD